MHNPFAERLLIALLIIVIPSQIRHVGGHSLWLHTSQQSEQLVLSEKIMNSHGHVKNVPISNESTHTCFRFAENDAVEWNVKNHSTNYWHVTFGIFVPLIVDMIESRAIMDNLSRNITMLHTTESVDAFFYIKKLLSQCFEIIDRQPSIKFSSQLSVCSKAPIIIIKRCDIPGLGLELAPVPRLDGSGHILPSSYFESCQKEDVFLKFRNYLGQFMPHFWGSSTAIGHRRYKKNHVLIVMRECKTEYESIHIHHNICFGNNTKFRLIIKEFEKRGFSTYATYFNNITVKRQAELFASASIIIVPHGAEIANALYTRSGTLFVELTPYFTGLSHFSLHHLLQQQSLLPKRNMLQSISKHFWSKKVFTRHIALPSTPSNFNNHTSINKKGVGGELCSIWSCFGPEQLTHMILKHYQRLEFDLFRMHKLS